MQKKIIFSLMSSLVLASACSILSPVVTPEVKEYQITSTTSGNLNCTKSVNQFSVQVSPVTVATPFDAKEMYYSVSEYQLSTYSLNKWSAMPSSMFTQAVIQKLQTSCLYSDVSSGEFMVSSKYRITNQVIDFKQVVKGSSSSTVNLNVYSQLIDNSTNAVIKKKTFVETVSVEATPSGYVKGANEVTNSFTNDLVTWLSTK